MQGNTGDTVAMRKIATHKVAGATSVVMPPLNPLPLGAGWFQLPVDPIEYTRKARWMLIAVTAAFPVATVGQKSLEDALFALRESPHLEMQKCGAFDGVIKEHAE